MHTCSGRGGSCAPGGPPAAQMRVRWGTSSYPTLLRPEFGFCDARKDHGGCDPGLECQQHGDCDAAPFLPLWLSILPLLLLLLMSSLLILLLWLAMLLLLLAVLLLWQHITTQHSCTVCGHISTYRRWSSQTCRAQTLCVWVWFCGHWVAGTLTCSRHHMSTTHTQLTSRLIQAGLTPPLIILVYMTTQQFVRHPTTCDLLMAISINCCSEGPAVICLCARLWGCLHSR